VSLLIDVFDCPLPNILCATTSSNLSPNFSRFNGFKVLKLLTELPNPIVIRF
jgi:hypothetical protein